MENTNQQQKEPTKRKEYVKPAAVKHEAASVVAGSSSKYTVTRPCVAGLTSLYTYSNYYH